MTREYYKHLLCSLALRYNGPNLVLKYDRTQNKLVNIALDNRDSPYYALRDRAGNAIGVTACDVDGDGREEIYFLNTNNAYSGKRDFLNTTKLSNANFLQMFLLDACLCRTGYVFRQAFQVSQRSL